MSARTIRKIALSLLLVIAGLATLLHFAMREARELRRDPTVMMNRYYLLQKTNPEAARRTLEIIVRQDPEYAPALEQLATDLLNSGASAKALPLLETLHRQQPENHALSLKLAGSYLATGAWDQAFVLYQTLHKTATTVEATRALQQLTRMQSFIAPINGTHTTRQPIIETPSLLVQALKAKYWALKTAKDPEGAQTLRLLGTLAPNDPQVLLEGGYQALGAGNKRLALTFFEAAFEHAPNPGLALQMAYLYMDTGRPQTALPFFLLAATHGEGEGREAGIRGLAYVQALNAQNAGVSVPGTPAASTLSPEQLKMDEFYALMKHNKKAAWALIQQIVKTYPKNVAALKSAGYLAIEFKNTKAAIGYFTRAWDLTFDPAIALQLGYLYDLVNVKPTAYQYFQWATASTDNTVVYRAQNAMTNLRGLQTKALPDPWFGEVFFDPFSQSQFGLTVRPLVARLGVDHDNQFHTKTYLVFRQTDDNKTNSFGQLPQIYEDNVRIIGTGVQVTPIAGIPLIAFAEGGAAYDLIYRLRPRWRPDLRAGIMYFKEFGAQPAWFEHFRVGVDYYSTAYADITYFSRYQNNVIATLKTHQGVRLLQYKSSMLNLYWEGRVIEDTQRQFFNNIGETGPGIGFIPTNRFNFEIRAEHLRGVYFPVGASYNPYPPYYTRNVVQLLFYARV